MGKPVNRGKALNDLPKEFVEMLLFMLTQKMRRNVWFGLQIY